MILPGARRAPLGGKMKKLIVAAGAAMLALVASAGAQNFPSRPITMIVPFAAGGPTDVLARILAEGMRASLGQTVLIENVTGAAGSIGVGKAVRAAPDGYTLSIGHWSTHVINGAIYKLPYDLITDLAPVSLLSSNPQLIVANLKVPADDLKSLVAWIKANPDKVAAGTAGPGSASHVGGIYFQGFSGTKFLFVPYRGTGPAMQDLIAGQIQLMLDQSSNSLPQVRNKQIKAFAVTAKTRLAAAPDIPTVDEAGLPGFYISVWHGLWVPKDTPMPIIAKLTAAVQAALADATVRKRLVDLGQDIPPREQQTPEALAAYQKAEIAKWWPIIKAANIKVE
jgi:tripartite-type tricarboxylate transporter receptor subunit TctC